MGWKVEATDEFAAWFASLSPADQERLRASIVVLQDQGPQLGRPYVDTLNGSRHKNMKELRTQSKGDPLRTFFAFDPTRTAILLIGGNKGGDKRFYDRMLPIADDLYDRRLKQLGEGQD